jgi:hypothetical protein
MAYCLGRLVIRPGLKRSVVVLSELAGNPSADRSNLIDQRLLPPEEADSLRQLLDLVPVPQVLSSIDETP